MKWKNLEKEFPSDYGLYLVKRTTKFQNGTVMRTLFICNFSLNSYFKVDTFSGSSWTGQWFCFHKGEPVPDRTLIEWRKISEQEEPE